MDDWFTLERIDEDTDILSEYRHWEETHCYLLRGRDALLLAEKFEREAAARQTAPEEEDE